MRGNKAEGRMVRYGNNAGGGGVKGRYGNKTIKWCMHVQYNPHIQLDKMGGLLKSSTACMLQLRKHYMNGAAYPKEFKQKPGPKLTIPGIVKEIFLFFTTPLLELIVEESNRYAAECMGPEKYDKRTEITVEEVCAYMGFMLLMGIVHLPSFDGYWKNDKVYHYSPIAGRISRNRFRELHCYLHFVDNSTLAPPGSPEYDRLGKV